MKTGWNQLDGRARLLVLVAGVLLLAATAGAWWALRPEQAVLFSDLRPQDAAVMATELERLKVPYEVADQGGTLLVDRSQVHATRLKLMGRDLPLHGSVGFELFNTTDFGMTEFAQKINFQRALQGELTRTILSFPEVRDARVHLALPEQGLFQQAALRPKAAITLGLRQGRALRPEQVRGIQRLVAAAVPGLAAQEVTIVDQQGIALSGAAEGEAAGAAGGSWRLELKRDTEAYLSRKAGQVLENLFGPGQALASVDVTLNMDQVRVTTEDVLPAADAKGGTAAGVLVRERESTRDNAAPETRGTDARLARGSSMQHDAEYQAGRRVEQVVGQPGAVRQLQVLALVRQELDAARREQVRQLVAAAVGVSPERGDTVVVQGVAPPAPATPQAAPPPRAAAAAATAPDPFALWPFAVAALAIVAASLVGWWAHRRGRKADRAPVLDLRQRELVLQRVQGWMLQAQAAPGAAASTSSRQEAP